jgi:hypothetical protein
MSLNDQVKTSTGLVASRLRESSISQKTKSNLFSSVQSRQRSAVKKSTVHGYFSMHRLLCLQYIIFRNGLRRQPVFCKH